jgi:hypothetical protein
LYQDKKESPKAAQPLCIKGKKKGGCAPQDKKENSKAAQLHFYFKK